MEATVFYFDESVLCRVGSTPPRTVELAVRESFAKWVSVRDYMVVTGRIPHDGGEDTCGLCMRYLSRACHGCPIYNRTGKIGCDGTPYRDYVKAEEENDLEAAITAAKGEVALIKRVARNLGIKL